jgi:hypothetical protein
MDEDGSEEHWAEQKEPIEHARALPWVGDLKAGGEQLDSQEDGPEDCCFRFFKRGFGRRGRVTGFLFF